MARKTFGDGSGKAVAVIVVLAVIYGALMWASGGSPDGPFLRK